MRYTISDLFIILLTKLTERTYNHVAVADSVFFKKKLKESHALIQQSLLLIFFNTAKLITQWTLLGLSSYGASFWRIMDRRVLKMWEYPAITYSTKTNRQTCWYNIQGWTNKHRTFAYTLMNIYIELWIELQFTYLGLCS